MLLCYHTFSICPHSLAVRTPPFQGGSRGFEPRWGYQALKDPLVGSFFIEEKATWVRTREGTTVLCTELVYIQMILSVAGW